MFFLDFCDKMANAIVSLLPLEATSSSSDTGHIILSSEWRENDVLLRLFTPRDLSQALEATLSLIELKIRAEEFEIPVDEFIQETKKCLSINNGLEGFKYVYTEDDRKFTWKKTSGTLTLIYGQVQLTASDSSEGLVGVLTRLQDKNAVLEEENEKLRKEKDTFQLCHQELIEANRVTEADILSECRLLINSKKEKIRELEEKLKQQPVAEDKPEKSQDTETPLGNPFPAARKRNISNRIFSQSSQKESSDDSIPLAFLPKRKELLQKEKQKPAISMNFQNDTQDVAMAAAGQDSEDCNGLFDDL